MQVTHEEIIQDIIARAPSNRTDFNRVRREVSSQYKISQPSNRNLLKAYQTLRENKSIDRNEAIERFMRKANIRNLSGIAVITSLIKPYFCPGKCIYCPTEVRMPKSYIATEPAAARALRLDFSPYEQMKRRIEMLESNGHRTDKIEYIIKGGTWNAYPLRYQYWFMLESFKACNNFKRRTPTPATNEDDWHGKPITALQAALEKEQRYNENAHHRIIGLTLETRPDAISPKTIHHMRRQGCTRIELGLQAPDNKILALVKRGHTVDQFRQAMLLLRMVGFKVDLHFMPDLPSTTAKHDVTMYRSLFSDVGLRPDMVKIYPCTVIKSAELYEWLQDGRYTPYSEEELFEALLQMKLDTPRYCRISRLIRDIPSDEIEAGNKITNLREALAKEVTKRGTKCECLRCREIGRHHKDINADAAPELFVQEYDTIGGKEFFITFEDPARIAVYGFLRLRVPYRGDARVATLLPKHERVQKQMDRYMPELKDAAFIRELHVYGTLIGFGQDNARGSQHKGLGKKLVAAAEDIIHKNNFTTSAVISGVGVRGYYRKLAYQKRGTYMIKNL